jgi:hypothetical protein
MDWGRGARSTVEHGSSPAGAQQRGEHGELGLGLTRARAAAWQLGDSRETTEERELGNRGTRVSDEGEE